MDQGLKRFEKAYRQDFETALSEIKNGKKKTHWMWYIFPQIKGLGFSETSRYYSIRDMEEAMEFLDHPYIGKNLILITSELLKLNTDNATGILGKPDDRKLQSCMTLFSLASNTNPIFQKVLDKYFDGKRDLQTLKILDL